MEKKELDFDELHQAVNALMDQAGKGKAKKAPAESRTQMSAEPKEEPKLKPKQAEDDTSVQVTVKKPLPKISTSRGSHGRTMDVIGPKPTPKVTPPSSQPKRLAPTLQPAKIDTPPQEPVPVVQALEATQPDPAQKTGPTLTHSEHVWPDPLDVHGFEDKDQTELQKSDTKEPAAEPEEQESSTPFVTTKVEKRPLGAYAEAAARADDLADVEENQSPKEDILEPAKPTVSAVQQPKELSPEVVAVESAEPEFHPETSTQSEDTAASQDDLRQMAIPQQYKTAQTQASTAERPVFDTKEYHPAIEAHSTRRSTGWIAVLVFALVLIATLAVAYYVITGGFDLSAFMPK